VSKFPHYPFASRSPIISPCAFYPSSVLGTGNSKGRFNLSPRNFHTWQNLTWKILDIVVRLPHWHRGDFFTQLIFDRALFLPRFIVHHLYEHFSRFSCRRGDCESDGITRSTGRTLWRNTPSRYMRTLILPQGVECPDPFDAVSFATHPLLLPG
jgi:hypothetical protein